MIDKIICLAVDKRKDMWPALERDCQTCLNLPLQKFIAGSANDPTLKYNHVDHPYHRMMNRYVGYSPQNEKAIAINFNIFMSHKMILNKAMENNETILLMEDDAVFITNRWHSVWNSDEVQFFLSRSDWDALFLGYFQRQYEGDEVYGKDGELAWREKGKISLKRAQSNVPGRISGLQGVVLNKNFIPTLYNECNISPLDSFINRNLDRFRVWYLEPQIISVISNYSYCEGSFVNRKKFWE